MILRAHKIEDYFSDSYRKAHEAFKYFSNLDHRNILVSYCTSGRDMAGGYLFTDVVLKGNMNAENVLIIISGTHGVEGYAGSAVQNYILQQLSTTKLAQDKAIMMVHLLNSWGCAWKRRQTIENVDLNRNFIDFECSAPVNSQYNLMHPSILDFNLDVSHASNINNMINRFIEDIGKDNVSESLFKGQYEHSYGVNYGGRGKTFARIQLEFILKKWLVNAQNVYLIDIHTGLGKYSEPILFDLGNPSESDIERSREVFGDVIILNNDIDRFPYKVVGDLCSGVIKILKNATVTPVALEFGTYDVNQLFAMQVYDCWAWNFSHPYSNVSISSRCQLYDYFCPNDTVWRKSILRGSMELVESFINL